MNQSDNDTNRHDQDKVDEVKQYEQALSEEALVAKRAAAQEFDRRAALEREEQREAEAELTAAPIDARAVGRDYKPAEEQPIVRDEPVHRGVRFGPLGRRIMFATGLYLLGLFAVATALLGRAIALG